MWEQIHTKEIGPFTTTISVWDLNNRYVRIEHIMGTEVVAQNFLCTLTLNIHRSFDALREACQRIANEASDEEREIGMISEEERENARDQQEEDALGMPGEGSDSDRSIRTIPSPRRR